VIPVEGRRFSHNREKTHDPDMRKYLLAALITFAGGTLAHAQMLDQQEHCAMQAKRTFERFFARDQQLSAVGLSFDYRRSHYNTRIGKCLMLITVGDIQALLIDPINMYEYAFYFQQNDKILCGLILNPDDGPPAIKDCKTREEFDASVDRYLEE
jgi:hypothetical protein